MNFVEITALWCPSCLIMKKRYKELYQHFQISDITKYDFDLDYDQIQSFQVGNILPVVIVFHENQEILRIIGEKSVKDLITLIEGAIHES